MRSSAYECRLAETHRARRLRLLGSPPDLVHSGPVVQAPHPYAEPLSKALSDLGAHSLAVSISYFIRFRLGFQPPAFSRKSLAKSFTVYHTLSGSPKAPRGLYARARSRRLGLRPGAMQSFVWPGLLILYVLKTYIVQSPSSFVWAGVVLCLETWGSHY